MKHLPSPDALFRQWLHHPHAPTVVSFAMAGLFLGLAAWLIQRNLRHNEPGLRAPFALVLALFIAASGLVGAGRLAAPWHLVAGASFCVIAGSLFYFADHRRYVRDLAGRIVADRWEIVLRFAGFSWTRD